ncbi:MAG: hypothetical protein HN704_04420 [Bacteroidetes bacterium]|jgi:SNF family Na+-dependent transporter|nr:hypothetical protein [Bacteroidota bacterium]MBT6685956.1 hypothetical protein [Bacteroidota bacterium]MBT7144444.1 hypothetical protein [Bacteroidota bacterium]MBT7490837.1 hypothetical protein [Bacteroidota bacterium]
MEELLTLSELSVTIAGFAALFSILNPKVEKWTDLDKVNLVRFYMMVELACIVAVFCVIPVVLKGYFDEDTTFRSASALHCFVMVSYNIAALVRNKKYFGKLNITKISTTIIRILAVVIIAISFLNGSGIFESHYRENYMFNLYLIFCVDIYFFLRLLYFTVGKRNPDHR